MPIILPNLADYKAHFLKNGIKYALKKVDIPVTGLLSSLPSVSEHKTGWPWSEETTPVVYQKNKRWPKLTIVTPSYNQGQFIEQTIRSVLLQNYPNLEYIIIDGGSTDDTITILQKYSPWISYWQSEKDNGQSNAINKGFSLASGDYNAWINSDDYYLKEVFCNVMDTFVKTNVSFVYGYGMNFYYTENKFNTIKVPPLLDLLMRFPSLVQPSCFWDSKIHKPLWEDLHCSLDYELWLRMVKNVKRKLIKQPLSVANVHDDAKTSDPKMGVAWAKDHELICSPDAHGSVKNWAIVSLLNRIWVKLHR